MKLEEIVLAGIAVALVVHSQRKAVAVAQVQQANTMTGAQDPSNWYSDQWAQLYGGNLSTNGQNNVPSGYTHFGMQGTMGFDSRPYQPGFTNGL